MSATQPGDYLDALAPDQAATLRAVNDRGTRALRRYLDAGEAPKWPGPQLLRLSSGPGRLRVDETGQTSAVGVQAVAVGLVDGTTRIHADLHAHMLVG